MYIYIYILKKDISIAIFDMYICISIYRDVFVMKTKHLGTYGQIVWAGRGIVEQIRYQLKKPGLTNKSLNNWRPIWAFPVSSEHMHTTCV